MFVLDETFYCRQTAVFQVCSNGAVSDAIQTSGVNGTHHKLTFVLCQNVDNFSQTHKSAITNQQSLLVVNIATLASTQTLC